MTKNTLIAHLNTYPFRFQSEWLFNLKQIFIADCLRN